MKFRETDSKIKGGGGGGGGGVLCRAGRSTKWGRFTKGARFFRKGECCCGGGGRST